MLPFPVISTTRVIPQAQIQGIYELQGSTGTPAARRMVRCCSDGTYIYVYGGYTSSTAISNEFYRYDPVTSKFDLLPSPSGTAAFRSAICYSAGKIYLFGGNNASGVITNRFVVYDIQSSVWSTVNYTGTMPSASTYGVFLSTGSNIYYIGSNNDLSTPIYAFNTVLNQWSTLSSSPGSVRGSTTGGTNAVILNSSIYILNNSGVFMRYNIVQDSWNTLLSLGSSGAGNLVMAEGLVYCVRPNGAVYRYKDFNMQVVVDPGSVAYGSTELCTLNPNASEIYQMFGTNTSGTLTTSTYKIK